MVRAWGAGGLCRKLGLRLRDGSRPTSQEQLGIRFLALSLGRCRHPLRNFKDDFVFSQAEETFVEHELSNLADLIVERKKEGDTNQLYRATTLRFEEAFRAAFEAGIASDLDVEKAWKKFQKAKRRPKLVWIKSFPEVCDPPPSQL
jgi:hypothetical protein